MTHARCVQALVALAGALDVGRLADVVRQVVARHAILEGASWGLVDLRAIPATRRDDVRARRLRDARGALAAASHAGGCVRAQLLSWCDDAHDLLLTLDARGADAGTMSALGAEVLAAYAGASTAETAPSYAEIVEWRQALARQEGAEHGQRYWELHGVSPDAGREAVRTFSKEDGTLVVATRTVPAGSRVTGHGDQIPGLDDESAAWDSLRIARGAGLAAVAERAANAIGCALPAYLLASWQALFFRLDRTIPLTGVTVPARNYPELVDVVGPLDVALPLAMRGRGDLTFEAFARSVDRAWRGAVEWQEFYDGRRHGPAPDHVYDIGFAHVTWPDGWTLGDLRAQLTHPHVDLIAARVVLACCAMGDRRDLALHFDPRANPRASIDRLAGLWSVLLDDVAARPHTTLDSLQLLTPAERGQIVTDWNATTRVWTDAEAAPSLLTWVERQASRTPDAPAVRADDLIWTYAELHARANQIARRLRRLGVGAESRVAVWLPRSADLVAALVAVVKSGGAFVPLDPVAPPARLAFQVATVGATVVLTDLLHARDVPEGDYVIDVLDAPDAAWRLESTSPLTVEVSGDQLAYVIYTSGSTGEPKGAMNTQRGIANRLAWMQSAYALTVSDRVLQKTSSSFDVSVWEFFWPLGVGAMVVVARPGGQADPAYLAELIQGAGVTVLHFVPAMLEMFVEAGGLAAGASVRLMVSSGEALSAPLARRCLAAWPGRLENLYGPTEAAVDVTYQPCTADAMTETLVPIGRPIANTQVHILDAHGQPGPAGMVGELYLGGVQIGRGYWGQPAQTAERYVPDPFSATPGARLYRTGDRARHRADGVVDYIGRTDRQIKLHGNRIELGEIEAALRRDPRVQEAVVTLHGTGEGRRLAAYVIPRADEAGRAGLQRTRIETWQRVYADTYAATSDAGDDLNLAGWISSYTGEPIPTGEMRLWVAETVARLRALSPRRVLDIGCGTGLLLTRLAPDCARYIGIDVVPSVLARLEASVARRSDLQHVELRPGAAHELSFLPDDSVDLVILNSVVQYFPDVDYLLGVLAEAVRVTQPGGQVFIGDVRSLALLAAYHASVQLDGADAGVTAGELRERSRQAVRAEKELVLDAALFDSLTRWWPKVGRAEVALKGGAYDNELSRFRYDVTLRVGDKQAHIEPTSWVGWDEDGRWRAEVEQRLSTAPDASVGVRGLRDRRVAAAVAIDRRLQVAAAESSVSAIRAESTPPAGDDPESVLQWARQQGLVLAWARFASDGRYDLIINPQWTARAGEASPLGNAAFRSYANRPAPIGNDVALALQHALRRSLPDYMVPAYFVMLDAFPLTQSGKIDRRRLPAPDTAGSTTRDDVPPRTPVEEIIVGIWADVLGHARIGVTDQFLLIGGDSLSAVRVLVRLREAFGRDLSLRMLFEHPTPAALAEVLSRPVEERITEVPLEPVSRDQPLPASFGQERLWVVDRVTGSQAYRVSLAAHVNGPLDLRALAHAFTALATRHEVLRTTIGTIDGRPMQVIAPPGEVPLHQIDCRTLPSQARARAVDAALGALESYSFDLQTGPLWFAAIVRVDDRTPLLTCVMHHIVVDGWSVGVLLRDLSALYQAARTGQPALLPALTVQYADYAAWQRRALTPERQAAEVDYWRTQLADIAPQALPTDRPRGPLPGLQGGAVTRQWDAALSRDVQAWTRAQGATLFMVLLAAWQVLLARYGGQQDIAVGTPIAQRPTPSLEPLIGFFLNTLVLRTQVDGAMTWNALVAAVRARALAAYAHQMMPFERIIDALQPQRDLARTPFFQTMFVFQNNPRAAIDFGEAQLTPLDGRTPLAIYDLLLEASAPPEGIAWLLHYDARLFDRSTVERMLEHLTAFVRAALAAPEAPIGTLSILTQAERRQLESRDACPPALPLVPAPPLPGSRPLPPRPPLARAIDWPIDRSLAEGFERIVARHPARVAVKTRESSWTYRELSDRADRVAAAVLRAGGSTSAEAGRVALLCSHDAGMLAAILGVLKAARAYVPLDPRAPAARLRQIWSDAEPEAIVTDRVHAALAREIAASAHMVVIDNVPDAAADAADTLAATATATAAAPAPASASAPVPALVPAWPVVAPRSLAYLLYTSGSTGEPKGVVQSHRNVQHFIRTYAANLDLRPTDRLTLLPAYGFDAAVMDIFGALLTGGTLCPFSLRDATPRELADWIEAEQITVLHATPTVFRMLTGSLEPERRLASVRLVVLGGEAAWQSDAEQCARHFVPECVLVNGLGPTESTVTLQWFGRAGGHLTRRALPVGYPVQGTRVRLVDGHGYDAELFGQIVIESPYVALGYWRRDALTRAAFEDLDGDDGVRRYRTGDLGRRLPDGSLEFVGRIDNQVKLRGHRIELSEVETVVASHPAVREAAVSLATDAGGAEALIAYVVPREGDLPPASALRQFMAARLPGPMVPSRFVSLEALPYRPNGKVDREALPPPPPLASASAAYVAPRNNHEQQMADLWSDVLGVERLGVHDNFFELGGDSIKAIKITARLHALGLATTPWLLFQYQTIADLAPLLTSVPADEEAASLAIEVAEASLALADDQLDRLASRVEFEVS
jgi:amino acid adenylation domain-containing protein